MGNTAKRAVSYRALEKRIEELEAFKMETVSVFTTAVRAINRLEAFLFTLIKVAFVSGLTSYDELVKLTGELGKATSIHKFWDVPEPTAAPSVEELEPAADVVAPEEK